MLYRASHVHFTRQSTQVCYTFKIFQKKPNPRYLLEIYRAEQNSCVYCITTQIQTLSLLEYLSLDIFI